MKMDKGYDPFKTAITRNKLSKPTQILLNGNYLKEPILNMGCGKGEDGFILMSMHGIYMNQYDKYNPIFNEEEILNKEYNTIVCNYVFNVLPLEEHEDLKRQLLQYGGNVYICVRSDIKAVEKDWVYDETNLGYWTTNNTFQRFYTEEMVRQMFGEVEYIKCNSQMKLFKLKA